jgi:hypothetical protein
MESNTVNEVFSLTFKEGNYPCKRMEKNGSIFYVVKFNSSYLYLTKAFAQEGVAFWTSVPADTKLNHIVLELGKQIDNYNKNK